MRIAVVTTSYPADDEDPSGHFVRSEARQLAAAGHEVHVIAPLVATRTADRGVRVVALDGGDAFGWPGAATRLRARPRLVGSAARWASAARAQLCRLRPDRVVAHWSIPCAWPVALWLDAPLEAVSHGADVRLLVALPAALRLCAVRPLARVVERWRFVSAPLLDELCAALSARLAARLRSVAEVRPCVLEMPDVTEAIAERRGAFAGAELCVTVSRLVASKRVDRIIAHVAAHASPSRTLVVVGDGPERVRLEALARRAGIDARFVGRTSHREALTWIGAADKVLFASQREGLPTVLREAEALGTRVERVA